MPKKGEYGGMKCNLKDFRTMKQGKRLRKYRDLSLMKGERYGKVETSHTGRSKTWKNVEA